jgi:hypothetical protein
MNVLNFSTVCAGLCEDRIRKIWQPMLDWIVESPNAYTVVSPRLSSLCLRGTGGRRVHERALPRRLSAGPPLRHGPARCVVGE